MRYIALVHKEHDSSYGVSFPDFPGCISAGDTLDEALINAVDALSGHVRIMLADGDTVPDARSVEEILSVPEWAEEAKHAIVSAIPLVRDRGSTKRIDVSMDLGLVEAIDKQAKRKGQTRSDFLATAAKRELLDT
jgi:predicted RNase H-like HicB family nuclease